MEHWFCFSIPGSGGRLKHGRPRWPAAVSEHRGDLPLFFPSAATKAARERSSHRKEGGDKPPHSEGLPPGRQNAVLAGRAARA